MISLNDFFSPASSMICATASTQRDVRQCTGARWRLGPTHSIWLRTNDQKGKVPGHDGSIETRSSDGSLIFGQATHDDGQEETEQRRDCWGKHSRDDREGPSGETLVSPISHSRFEDHRLTILPTGRLFSKIQGTARIPPAI
jgi:hypothetical protein